MRSMTFPSVMNPRSLYFVLDPGGDWGRSSQMALRTSLGVAQVLMKKR